MTLCRPGLPKLPVSLLAPHIALSASTMMKLVLALLPISTLAFAPPSSDSSSSRSLAVSAEKVPCFGAAPFPGDRSIFFGENYWNALTTEWGTEDTGTYVRAAYVRTLWIL